MLSSLWRSLPTITRAGLVMAAVGVGADLLHHGFTQHIDAVQVLGIGLIGHALTLAGMVLALSGVVRAAVDMRRRARQKGESNAARCSTAAAR